VLVKPDGVKRGLVGEIIGRFERAGIKIAAMKLVWIDKDVAFKHYGVNDEWFERVGEKTKKFYLENGLDKGEPLMKLANKEIGKLVQEWNVDYLTEGPVVAMLLQAPGVVPIVRKMVGTTYPQDSLPGTIRGDFALESPYTSNTKKIAVRNLIHASGTPEEAEIERQLWFKESEIQDYKRMGED